MNELTHLIYEQLLELYIADLQVELLTEKLKNIGTGVPQIPVPSPWYPQRPAVWPDRPYDPYWYGPIGPSWIVTCEAQNGNV